MLALLDFDLHAMFCSISMGGVISGFAHANVRSDPPLFYSFFFTTIRHHSLHHTALSYEGTRCNYGNSLILIDRVFGTYREGESADRRPGRTQETVNLGAVPVPVPAADRRRSKRGGKSRARHGSIRPEADRRGNIGSYILDKPL